MTLQAVAERLNTSISRIRAWETGTTRIDGDHMERLAAAYGVDPFEMLPLRPGAAETDALSPRERLLLDAIRRRSTPDVLSIVASLAAEWAAARK